MSPASLDPRRQPGPQLPWWRVGMVWHALGGPAAVVVAGLVTAAIAVHGADPVLQPRAAVSPGDAAAPAQLARNHAAAAARGAGQK